MLTFINTLILFGQGITVAFIACCATFFTWKTLNLKAASHMIAKRDQMWQDHINEMYKDQHKFYPAWLDTEQSDFVTDEQDGDSRLTMIDHQGTPAPQPDGSVYDRWDGTTKAPPFKLMAQEVAWLQADPDALRSVADYHDIQEENGRVCDPDVFAGSIKFHHDRRVELIALADAMDKEFA